MVTVTASMGSQPVSAARPKPAATPEKMDGKKEPPIHPIERHIGVAAALARPVAMSTGAPMAAQLAMSSSDCTSPGKST